MAPGRRESAGATTSSTFHHDAYGLSTTCHGDDFLSEGSAPQCLGGQAVEGNHPGRTIA